MYSSSGDRLRGLDLVTKTLCFDVNCLVNSRFCSIIFICLGEERRIISHLLLLSEVTAEVLGDFYIEISVGLFIISFVRAGLAQIPL